MGASCKSVPCVSAPSIFGDGLKCVFKSRFRRLQEVNFSLRQGDGWIFKKIHNSRFWLTKKNSLPDLTHGFHDTLSKLGTNRQKMCLILRSTSVFSVFAKTGGGGTIFFGLFYLMLLQKVPEWFNSQLDRSRTPRIRTKFLRDRHQFWGHKLYLYLSFWAKHGF